MKLTLRQTAKMAGVSPATVSTALKNGKISGSKDEQGQWEIDASELDRVQLGRKKTPKLNKPEHPQKPDTTTLESEIAMLREMLEQANKTLEREREHTDEWRKQAQVLALTDERNKSKSGLFGLFKKAG